jgi:hypothetical protein
LLHVELRWWRRRRQLLVVVDFVVVGAGVSPGVHHLLVAKV